MDHDSVTVLALPGMSLNATIFPDFGVPTLVPALGDVTVAGPGMHPYLERLDQLAAGPSWSNARARVVVGHSFGGMLALAWLLARPDVHPAVSGLVLASTTAGPMFTAVRLRLLRLADWELRVGVDALLPFWNNEVVTRGMHRAMNRGRLVTRPVDFRTLRRRDDLSVGLAGWQATSWGARRAFRAAMEGFDVRHRLPELRMPTIVLHGGRDCYFPIEGARQLTRALGRASLRVVEDAGHVLPLTHGEEVVRAVRELAQAPPRIGGGAAGRTGEWQDSEKEPD